MTDERYTVEIVQQPEFVIELNEQGPQGPAGPAGPTGSAGTIDIGNTYTLDYPEENRVVNRGTSSGALLDFYLSRGPQGIQGEVGPSGGIFPVYNESTTTLEFFTFDPNDYTMYPPQQLTRLSQLENDVGYITDNNLTPLRNNINTNEDNIAMNASDIQALENRLDTTDTNVGSNTRGISTLETKTDTTNSNVTSLGNRVATNEQGITLLETKTDATNSNVASLDTRVTSNEQGINTLNQEVGNVGTALDELNGEDI